MSEPRSFLNYLVIAMMAFMTAITAVFVYASFGLKDRVTLRTVRQTEFAAGLLARSAADMMRDGHSRDSYRAILDYGGMTGMDEVGVLGPGGAEAAFGSGEGAGRGGLGNALPGEKEAFLKAVATMRPDGYFDGKNGRYTSYVPLKAEAPCLRCHSGGGDVLGVLVLRLSTAADLELLEFMRKLIWAFGAIVLLPVGGLLVAGAVIKEKNRIFMDLKQSRDGMEKTCGELNKTRYHLQMILDNSRVLIVTTDMQGRIVEFNREAEKLLEYSKEEVTGNDVLMLYDSPRQRSGMAAVREGGVWAARDREVRLRSKSGKVLHVAFTLSTLNDGGRIIGTVGVGKDISEQKMLQFKLMQSEKLAGIGTLATGIAHEINNPLAGILGMAEAIRDESDPSLIRSHAEDIIRYSENARRIVRELSDYSRAAQGSSEARTELSGVIRDSLRLARHSASLNDIEITAELESGCFISASQVEMQQVFVNLMVNAAHAMGGSGAMTLKCWNEGGFVKALVKDTGHGIPEEKMGQIFDPFFTTKPVGMGTGLGLFVVYRIITKYGGGIDVESTVGQGTAFTLRFPAGGSDDAAAEKKLIAPSS